MKVRNGLWLLMPIISAIQLPKNLLMAVLIGVSCFVSTPRNADCAELLKAARIVEIESVVSSGEGVATELILKLSAPATYTSYKTVSPLRLVIDLSQVSQGNIAAPVHINKGNFKTVTANRFDTDAGVLTRVEIGLLSDAEAVISTDPSKPGELKITFPQLNVSDLPAVSSPAAITAVDTTAPAVVSIEPASSIRTLNSITVKGNTIVFALDGTAGDFKTFRLNNPERFVVDLYNAKSVLPEDV